MSARDESLLDTLTDEEREAMADDGMSDEDRAALTAIANGAEPANTGDEDDDDDEDEGDDEGDEGDEGEGDDGDDGAAAAPSAAPAAAPADELANAPADDEPLPQYHAELPADYQTRVDALGTRTADIQQKYNDGEIDLAERDAELAKVQTEREELLLIRARAENLREINEQNARAQWQRQINTFMAGAKQPDQGGIDYAKDTDKAKDLDEFVRTLAKRPEHADKPGPWFLAEAHKRVLALHGIAASRPAPTPAQAKAKAAAVAARKPALDKVPQNLAAVPGSDGPGDVANEFADIDALEGQALEDAIARMTPSQREKYLAS